MKYSFELKKEIYEKHCEGYGKYTNFHVIPDWITYKRGDQNGNE